MINLRAGSSSIRIQHLLLLDALADTGTVRGAAKALHRTQPAVTKMLHELERALGIRLFERGRLGTHPTAAGRALIHRARMLLNEWHAVEREVDAIEAGGHALLRVGATPMVMLTLIPRALVRFRRELPEVALQFREGSIHDLILALHDGELDCVIGRFSGELIGSDVSRNLAQEKLCDDTLCIVAAPAHPLVRKRRVTWLDLAACDWVLPPVELATRQILNAAFIRAGHMPPHVRIESSSFATSIVFASKLGLLSVAPLEAARIAQAQGLVKILRTQLGSLTAPISILRRRGAVEGEQLEVLLTCVREGARG